jgi:hypothetical protein
MNLSKRKTNISSTIYLVLPLFIGFIISIIILNYFSPDSLENKINFDELALGNETSLYNAQVNSTQVHCYNLEDAKRCIDGYYKKSKNINDDVVLWLGNSQLHSINQMKPGDETASSILHRSVIDLQKYFMTFSQPNANLQEHYVLFNYLISKVPVSTLVLPVVFDDMREIGIRRSISDAFKDQHVVNELKKTGIGKRLLSNYDDQDMIGNDMAALEETIQESVEIFLDTKLGSYWKTWRERPHLRASFFYGFLYKSRNWLFNINPSSVRKVIPGRYIMNIQALQAILKTAQEKSIDVLLYIVPIRNDIQIPYDLVEYGSLKEEIRIIANGYYNVTFKNLEGLVPAKFWGSKDSTSIVKGVEVDFMHFQGEGHQILAGSILFWLRLISELSDINDI